MAAVNPTMTRSGEAPPILQSTPHPPSSRLPKMPSSPPPPQSIPPPPHLAQKSDGVGLTPFRRLARKASSPPPTHTVPTPSPLPPSTVPPLPRSSKLPLVKGFHMHTYNANLRNEDRYVIDVTSSAYHLFGVFDGHGGTECSGFVESMIAPTVRQIIDARLKDRDELTASEWEEVLVKALCDIDHAFVKLHAHECPTKGSCALLCCVTKDAVYTACVGDSRAVLCRRNETKHGVELQHIPLSRDQDCTNELECDAVTQRTSDPNPIRRGKGPEPAPRRVAGSLMVTRAMGDSYLKHAEYSFPPFQQFLPYITCVPVVTKHTLSDGDHSLVLASDGLYNMLSNQEVVEVAHKGILMFADSMHVDKSLRPDPAKMLVESALQKVASAQSITIRMLQQTPSGPTRRRLHDDITVIVVELGANTLYADPPLHPIITSPASEEERRERMRDDIKEDWDRQSSVVSLELDTQEQQDTEAAREQKKLGVKSELARLAVEMESSQGPAAAPTCGIDIKAAETPEGLRSLLKSLSNKRRRSGNSRSPPPPMARMPSGSPLPERAGKTPGTPTLPSPSTPVTPAVPSFASNSTAEPGKRTHVDVIDVDSQRVEPKRPRQSA
eukprot:Sspe_Gene.39342::Locus_18979_Transcript_1_1_Confidence_1.000_Length_2106::g.39342::m.39342